MNNRNDILSRILLINGIILILLSLVHLLETPIVSQWLTGQLTEESISKISPITLFNHILIGMLLIPFGISTMFSAAGIRVGQKWARAIAYTNSIVIIIVPLTVYVVMGSFYFDNYLSIIATSMITIAGLSMLLSLIWLRDVNN
ncbi:MAG: hypothetical protein HZB59_12025 [Ignavibacteriales bacterium]|nr:hypothetical protein [Ignavibacteriales bacterium]